jgi:LacI family transcriptional regulator
VSRRSTVRDIAAETGVSIATVSRVLNGQTNVAPHTRDLVQQAVDRLGAQAPEPRTPPPRDPAAGAVYVRCPYLLTDYFGLIVSSIAETLSLHGRRVILDAGEATQHSPVLAGLADQRGIDGAILILPPESSRDLAQLRNRGFPFVVVDPRTALPKDVVAVSAAHLSGARSVTNHLLTLGHRRIGVIAGPNNWLASDARLAGHGAALSEAGLLPDPELIRHVEPTTEHGRKAAVRLLSQADRPTAIVGFCDKSAVGALVAARELGLRVPEDLSVTGFDDIDLSRVCTPTLTTVRQPLREMGRMAVTLLVHLLDRHKLEALHVELATELVVRDSTGPVPS